MTQLAGISLTPRPVSRPAITSGPTPAICNLHLANIPPHPTPPQGPHIPRIEANTEETRMFRNYFGGYREDGTEGSDMAAVGAGWVSITPLGLRSDLLFKVKPACLAIA